MIESREAVSGFSFFRHGPWVVVTVVLLAACSQIVPQGGSHGDRPSYPVDQVLESASLIALVTVTSVEEPRWNSQDGRDWTAEYDGAKGEYVNGPYQFTKVTIAIDEILVQDGGPEVSAGDVIAVEVYGDPSLSRVEAKAKEAIIEPYRNRYVADGEKRVAFLYRRDFPNPRGGGPEVWQADPEYGFWGLDIDKGVAVPGSRFQQQELATDASRWSAVAARGGQGIPFRVLREAKTSG